MRGLAGRPRRLGVEGAVEQLPELLLVVLAVVVYGLGDPVHRGGGLREALLEVGEAVLHVLVHAPGVAEEAVDGVTGAWIRERTRLAGADPQRLVRVARLRPYRVDHLRQRPQVLAHLTELGDVEVDLFGELVERRRLLLLETARCGPR